MSKTRYKFFNRSLAFGLVAIGALGGAGLLGVWVPEYAAAGTDTAGSTSGYYVSVSSADTLALHLNATPGGTVGSVQDTLTVSSNTPNGYKVYISSPTSSTGSNYLCPAGVTPSTSACFVPTASADSLLNLSSNSWGYSLNGTSYSPVPLLGSEDTIISKTTASSESGTTMPIYFGVKADMAMSGSYTGRVMYTAIADTSGTTRLTTISPTTTEKLDGGETLTINVPYTSSRTVEEIKAGLSVSVGGTAAAVTAVSEITAPYTGIQVTATAPAKSAGKYNVVVTVTLPQGTTIDYTASSQFEYQKKKTTMQEFASSSTCSSMSAGDTLELGDSRDANNTYRVRKLKDGNCWMIDSLRLAGVVLDSTASDMTSGTFTLPAASTSTSGASYSAATVNINTGDFVNDGYLYNWYAATAGEGTQSKSSGDVSKSVCPKGWKLPSGGDANTNQSFAKLYAQSDYNSAAKMTSKTNNGPEFTLAGLWSNGYGGQGSYGYYWSRTADDSSTAYNLNLDSSSVGPQDYNYKNYGFSVRCVTS